MTRRVTSLLWQAEHMLDWPGHSLIWPPSHFLMWHPGHFLIRQAARLEAERGGGAVGAAREPELRPDGRAALGEEQLGALQRERPFDLEHKRVLLEAHVDQLLGRDLRRTPRGGEHSRGRAAGRVRHMRLTKQLQGWREQAPLRSACEGDAREMHGRCKGDAREMQGRCEGDAREMQGRCEG
eukprot:1818045-Prymnesium_polylepis.1